jgi:hypothetical protein
MMHPRPICLALLKDAVLFAAALAWANTGNKIAARIAIIAITTSSSMRVKALDLCDMGILEGAEGSYRTIETIGHTPKITLKQA